MGFSITLHNLLRNNSSICSKSQVLLWIFAFLAIFLPLSPLCRRLQPGPQFSLSVSIRNRSLLILKAPRCSCYRIHSSFSSSQRNYFSQISLLNIVLLRYASAHKYLVVLLQILVYFLIALRKMTTLPFQEDPHGNKCHRLILLCVFDRL